MNYPFHHRFAHLRCSPRQNELRPLEPAVGVEKVFRGERGVFDLCDVFVVTRHGGRDAAEVMATTLDWQSEEAPELADVMLRSAYGYAPPELCQAFADEVLSKLPRERWELPARDVEGWAAGYWDRLERLACPPRADPDAEEELPGDVSLIEPEGGTIDDEGLDRMKKRLRDLGMLDDGEETNGEA